MVVKLRRAASVLETLEPGRPVTRVDLPLVEASSLEMRELGRLATRVERLLDTRRSRYLRAPARVKHVQ